MIKKLGLEYLLLFFTSKTFAFFFFAMIMFFLAMNSNNGTQQIVMLTILSINNEMILERIVFICPFFVLLIITNKFFSFSSIIKIVESIKINKRIYTYITSIIKKQPRIQYLSLRMIVVMN